MRKPIFITVGLITLVLIIFTEIIQSSKNKDDHIGLIDFIKAHQEGVQVNVENLRPEAINTIDLELKGKHFKVATRRDKMKIQNCAVCHDGSLIGKESSSSDRISVKKSSFLERKAHWEIINPHGGAETISCTTCHNRDNLDRLNIQFDGMGTGKTAGFDKSFRLCAQCHSRELKDWSGGAHGKRLVGWAGQKVINNCTDCHNPHSPRFPTKRPVIMSPLPGVKK